MWFRGSIGSNFKIVVKCQVLVDNGVPSLRYVSFGYAGYTLDPNSGVGGYSSESLKVVVVDNNSVDLPSTRVVSKNDVPVPTPVPTPSGGTLDPSKLVVSVAPNIRSFQTLQVGTISSFNVTEMFQDGSHDGDVSVSSSDQSIIEVIQNDHTGQFQLSAKSAGVAMIQCVSIVDKTKSSLSRVTVQTAASTPAPSPLHM